MNIIENEKEELSHYRFPKNITSSLYGLIDVNNYEKHLKARKSLVEKGEKILPVMYKLMNSDHKTIRKEAVKVVELIADKSSIPEIINALKDRESDIRWIAAEALIRIGRSSINPLLEALVADGKSSYLRQGAHHVLSRLTNEKDSDRMKQLIRILRNSQMEGPESIPVYAAIVLNRNLS